jgi:hypothetical protein
MHGTHGSPEIGCRFIGVFCVCLHKGYPKKRVTNGSFQLKTTKKTIKPMITSDQLHQVLEREQALRGFL